MAPKVSVVIPNFNHAKFLRQRIDSVLNQTYKNFEVIILDDCSVDGSAAIIQSYANHPQVAHVLINARNSGSPFLQWKKGTELAVGEWIWIAESDDYADERFLEKLIDASGKHSSVGLVYCDSNVVENNIVMNETLASIKNAKLKTTRWGSDYFNNGANEIENYLLPDGTINNTSAVLFKRDVFVDVCPFDISLQYIGDKYAFIKVLSRSDVVYVKEALNYFRNPFNKKHADKLVFNFYEQFLIFNWVYKNLKLLDKRHFYNGFYNNTRNSLFRDWGVTKLSLYFKLLMANPMLLLINIHHNFREGLRSILDKRRVVSAK